MKEKYTLLTVTKPLKYTVHKHITPKSIDSGLIIDDISYNTVRKVFNLLIFSAILLNFIIENRLFKLFIK